MALPPPPPAAGGPPALGVETPPPATAAAVPPALGPASMVRPIPAMLHGTTFHDVLFIAPMPFAVGDVGAAAAGSAEEAAKVGVGPLSESGPPFKLPISAIEGHIADELLEPPLLPVLR
mmetsp:Transcript_150478/g.483718  ORF Transcript_150478/g.483718 Transcript_150478/m.483718 type:complete len:119 (-) Transcript_150478:783-1139(-)